MNFKGKMRKKSGITLISLVVTIIVLLILAGISISMLTGQNGILNKASEATQKTEIAKEKESINLAWQALKIGKIIAENENIQASELENQLHLEGQSSASVMGKENLIITFSDTGHSYTIEQEGNIISENLEQAQQVADSNPGEFNGEGTQESPYLIESIEDLVALSTNSNKGEQYTGKYFKLKTTLDFNSEKSYMNPEEKYMYDTQLGGYVKNSNGEAIKSLCTSGKGFISIGINKNNKQFEGIFDGNGNTIKNLYINREENLENMINYIGLFGFIGNTKIENLTLTGEIMVNSSFYVGGVVGYANEGSVIKNCNNEINIKGNSLENVGGLVACIYGSIENCTNQGNIVITKLTNSTYVGGITGICCNVYLDDENEKIKKCTNYGKIMINGYKYKYSYAEVHVGGISGYNNGTSVEECVNNGSINSQYINNVNIGGISGYNDSWQGSEVIISNSINKGDLKGISTEKNVYIGGIVGYSELLSTITSSTNSAIINGEAPKGQIYKDDICGHQET